MTMPRLAVGRVGDVARAQAGIERGWANGQPDTKNAEPVLLAPLKCFGLICG